MSARYSPYRVIARRFGLGRNSLRRTSDRIEAAVLWLALVGCLLLVPVSAALGTGVQRSSVRQAEIDGAGLTRGVAVALESVPVNPAATVVVPRLARATWTDQHGIVREGMVMVPSGTRAGAPVNIWLDASGTPADAPRSRGVSAAVGTMTGLAMFAGGLLGIWLFVLSVRSLLDRWRRRCWTADWDRVAGTWCRC